MLYIFSGVSFVVGTLLLVIAPTPLDSVMVAVVFGFLFGLGMGKFRYPHLSQREFVSGEKALIYMILSGSLFFFLNYLSLQGFLATSAVTYVFPFTLGILMSVATTFAYHYGEAAIAIRTAMVFFLISLGSTLALLQF